MIRICIKAGIIKAVLSIAVILFLFPLSAIHAKGNLQDGISEAGEIDDALLVVGGLGPAGVAYYLGIAIDWLLSLVAILALAALIWGAISYILSLGDDAKIQKAKKIILAAIVGLILAGVSFLIITVIETLLTS